MFRPCFIIIPRLLLCLEPAWFIFPTGDEINAPYHDEQRVDEIAWTIVSWEIKKVVKECGYESNDCGKNEPFLHKAHKLKIYFVIWAYIIFHTLQNDGRIFGIFMNRQHFLEMFVFHYINEWELIQISALLEVFYFFPVSEEKIVLASQLLLWWKQSSIYCWVHVDFMLVKHTVTFLLFYPLISRQISGRYVAQVIGVVDTVCVFCLLNSFINIFFSALKQRKWFLILDF